MLKSIVFAATLITAPSVAEADPWETVCTVRADLFVSAVKHRDDPDLPAGFVAEQAAVVQGCIAEGHISAEDVDLIARGAQVSRTDVQALLN